MIVASYGGDINFVHSAATLAVQARHDGKGYWLASGDGAVFTYGDARYYGSAVGMSRSPIVGIATTPDGKGYWLVSSDGTVLNFGDAGSFRSTGSVADNQAVVGMG